MKNLSIEQKYLISLLRSALNNEVATPPDDLNYAKLYRLATDQSVMQMIYTPFVEQNNLPSNILAHYEEAFGKATVKEIIQEVEVRDVMAKLSELGVRHVPLKGFVVKNLYPLSCMRTSCDVDILYEHENFEKMREALISCGYVEESAKGNHAVYYKEPVMNIEMHNELFAPGYKYGVIFSDIWERMKPSEDDKYLYHMSIEDFYLHSITHTAKHFEGSGTGIRSVIDIYLLLKNYGDTLDRDYINEKLTIVSLNKFADNIDLTAKMLFDKTSDVNAIEDEAVIAITHYLLSYGSYGTMKNRISHEMADSNSNRTKILFQKIFLRYQDMIKMYPFLIKYKFLLPFAWIVRLVVNPFRNPQRVKTTLKVITTSDKDSVDKLYYTLRISGISQK